MLRAEKNAPRVQMSHVLSAAAVISSSSISLASSSMLFCDLLHCHRTDACVGLRVEQGIFECVFVFSFSKIWLANDLLFDVKFSLNCFWSDSRCITSHSIDRNLLKRKWIVVVLQNEMKKNITASSIAFIWWNCLVNWTNLRNGKSNRAAEDSLE